MSRKPPIFRLTDVRKAFEAAQAAGVTARVDITQDGKLSIVPVEKPLNDPPPASSKPGRRGEVKAGFQVMANKFRSRAEFHIIWARIYINLANIFYCDAGVVQL
jgi:hypothetical protein